MSFGLTPQGFNRMLESDLNTAIAADLAPLFGVDPSVTDWPTTDSPLSQLLAPFCRQLGLVWELAEASYAAGDPAQAFGTLMDGLLALNNLARLEATSTTVLAAISGTQGLTVPAGSRASTKGVAALFAAVADGLITNASLLRIHVQVSNVSTIGTPYAVTVNGHVITSGTLSGSPTRDSIAGLLLAAINASSLVNSVLEAVLYGPATILVGTVTNLAAYTVTVNGQAITYTSDASATSQEIVDGLVAAINAGQSALVALGLSSSTFSLTPVAAAVPATDWTLALTSNLGVASLTPTGAFALKAVDLKTPFSCSVDSRMAIDKLFSPQTYAAVATGPVEAPSGSLITIESPLSGFTAITNFLDGVLGTDVETDDAARIRREQTLVTGEGSSSAIVSELFRLVQGVSLVRVYENLADTPDSEGRPGHSVEVLVVGGADADVALVVWNTRSGGIPPFGNINADGSVDPDGNGTGISILDSNGIAQTVHFSRPEVLYGYIHATKTLYSEEIYPVNGDQAIKDALLAFCNTLTMGNDLLNQRIAAAAINVPGVGSLSLTIAVGHDSSTPPSADNTPTAGDVYFTASNISVGTRQRVVFDSSRITVT